MFVVSWKMEVLWAVDAFRSWWLSGGLEVTWE